MYTDFGQGTIYLCLNNKITDAQWTFFSPNSLFYIDLHFGSCCHHLSIDKITVKDYITKPQWKFISSTKNMYDRSLDTSIDTTVEITLIKNDLCYTENWDMTCSLGLTRGQGFFSWGTGGSLHPAKILPIPSHPTLVPIFGPRFVPPSRGSSPKIWII